MPKIEVKMKMRLDSPQAKVSDLVTFATEVQRVMRSDAKVIIEEDGQIYPYGTYLVVEGSLNAVSADASTAVSTSDYPQDKV